VTQWVRFRHQDQTGFGTLSGESITVHHDGIGELTNEFRN
jgi:hypothetical protein